MDALAAILLISVVNVWALVCTCGAAGAMCFFPPFITKRAKPTTTRARLLHVINRKKGKP